MVFLCIRKCYQQSEVFVVFKLALFKKTQFNLLKVSIGLLSSVFVNSLNEMLLPPSYFSRNPDFITLFVHIYCYRAACVYVCLDLYVCLHVLFIVLAMMSIMLG